jgi:hypothetical protein
MILFIAFPFVAAGCAAFLFCAAIPPLRRFALSSSLWCVACVPCLLVIFATVILWSAGITALQKLLQSPFAISAGVHRSSWTDWLFFSIAVIVALAGTTVITLIHGIIIRRLTLALFRLYATAVSFGVGILSCAFLSLSFGEHLWTLTFRAPTAFMSLLLASALAYVCFRSAPHFRGSYPQRFPVVTYEEFDWKGQNPK